MIHIKDDPHKNIFQSKTVNYANLKKVGFLFLPLNALEVF
jgi:hypothetical protein